MKLMIKYFKDAISRFKKEYAISLLLSTLSAILIVSIPLILNQLLNLLANHKQVIFYLGILIIIALLGISVDILKYVALDKFGGKYINDLLSRLQRSLITNQQSSKIKSLDHILYADVLDVFRVIGNLLPNISSSSLILIMLLIVASLIDYKVVLWLIILCLIIILISYYARTKIQNYSSNTNAAMKKLHQHLENFANSLEFIKTNNLNNYYLSKTSDYVNKFIGSAINEDRYIYLYSGLMNKTLIIVQFIFSLVVSITLANNPNDLIVYTFIFTFANNECLKIEQSIRQINRSMVCFKNIDSLLKPIPNKPKTIDKIKNIEIKIDNFGYGNETIIKDFKFSCSQGDTILIQGANGTGKSTLVKIIAQLINNYQGDIKINGLDINQINNLYNRLLYISQNDSFLDSTIREYLTVLNKEPLSEESIQEVFNNINLDLSLDTLLDVNGSNLSGGQKKKVQLAHLILNYDSYDAIILDELDAGLDIQTNKIYSHLIKQMNQNQDKIIFVISHNNDLFTDYNQTIKL